MGRKSTKKLISGFHQKSILSVSDQFNSSSLQLYYQYLPGEVTDIILDDTHINYVDSSDIGKVQISSLYKQLNNNKPIWAKPIYANIKTYPVLHLIVLFTLQISNTDCEISGLSMIQLTWYYDNLNSINVYNSKYCNPMVLISKSYLDKSENTWNVTFGKTFDILKTNHYKLIPKLGDTIILSRYGSNVRLSNDDGHPTIIISNILSSSLILSLDINDLDSSFIWVTTSQSTDIPLLLSSDQHKSIFDKMFNSKFNGRQIIINSDRVILNSKLNLIVISANTYVNISSNQQVGIESLQVNVIGTLLTTMDGKTLNILNELIYMCNNGDQSNPSVLGKLLVLILQLLISLISKIQVTTPTGLSSPPNNVINLQVINNKLRNILSNHIYIK